MHTTLSKKIFPISALPPSGDDRFPRPRRTEDSLYDPGKSAL